jgi:hypothetical protein
MAAAAAVAAVLVLAGCGVAATGDSSNPPADIGGTPTPLSEPLLVAGKPAGRIDLMIQGTRPVSSTPLASARLTARSIGAPALIDVTGADGVVQGTIALTDARIVLKEFKFKRPETDLEDESEQTENEEVKLRGPFVVDLLTDIVTPALPAVDVVAGTYTEIQVKIDRIEGTEEDDSGMPLVDPSDPLFGNSIYLAGTYSGTLGGDTVTDVPFSMSFDLDEELTLAAPDPTLGFVVDQDMLQTVILAFRIAQWFDFSDPEANPDAVDFASLPITAAVVLDRNAEDPASALREVIKHKIEASADYGRDSDGDHRLDSSEDEDPPAADIRDGTGADGEDDSAEQPELSDSAA